MINISTIVQYGRVAGGMGIEKAEACPMNKGRLEAFSDGVFAVIITIMVLDMKVPQGTDVRALKAVIPIFLCYVLSYMYVGIYWNNHHHLLHAADHVTGGILWANLALLFCLSLAPFTTAWMGENHYAPLPVATYGVMLLLAGIAYFILTKSLVAHHGENSVLAKAIGNDWKGTVSVLVYAVAIPLAFVKPWMACSLYTFVAFLWLLPDRRIEKRVHQ
jgi:uncharacterized membrane protein